MSGYSGPLRILSAVFQPLYQFLYPAVCIVCQARLAGSEYKVCSSCWGSIKPVSKEDDLYRQQTARLADRDLVARLVSAYHFEKEGTLQTLIHGLKYNGMTNLGNELGRRLGRVVESELKDLPVDGIIPVPLHCTKERERGYNQATFIAEGLSEATGIPVLPAVLVRHKYTKSQTRLSSEERQANVGDAFSVNPASTGRLHGRVFIVVDDVLTTGATIEACAEVLTGNGAGRVVACAVALAE